MRPRPTHCAGLLFLAATFISPQRSEAVVCCPGDLNGNGFVQPSDIPILIQVMLTSSGTADELCAADVDENGIRNGRDLQEFVDRLLSGIPCSQIMGACCLAAGACEVRTQTQCGMDNGCHQGSGSVCSPNSCVCAAGRCDLDGLCSNGCEVNVNGNPPCNPPMFLGTVSGDTGTTVLNDSHHGETWYRVTITEDSNLNIYLSAWVDLQSAPGSDYVLYVYCVGCVGSLAGSSTSGTGQLDHVEVRWNDELGQNDNGSIVIEVRWFGGGCDGYNLTITGNTNVTTVKCDQ